ncbi:PPC domain-containing protein [Hyalangium versicolor]|uniref:PPC domain-containing protein n=1 Tax=Hyalangium versicolor TaxID=2861190 RepID=UPI001CCFEBD2|nr:PPC domain-containing protein [Hyalangium versicolor]
MKPIAKTFFQAVSLLCALVACGSEPPSGTQAQAEPRPEVPSAEAPQHLIQALAGDCTDTVPLSASTPVTGLGAATQGWSCLYALQVPIGAVNLKFITSGGTGDADLYVKFNAEPTSTTYDCRGQTGGNSNESCTLPSPVSGTWYVRLQGRTQFSGVTLTGSYQKPSNCDYVTALTQGTPVSYPSVASGAWGCIYALEVPAGATDIKFTTSGGSGNGDLYVKYGSEPTLSSYSCRSASLSNADSCVIPTPQAGTYYVRTYGTNSASGVSLTGSYFEECTTVSSLTPGTAVGNLNAPANRWSCTYALQVPARATNLQFITSGGTGNADLYVRFGEAPTQDTYDCKSSGTTSAETCTIPLAQGGTYYVRLMGPAAYSGVSLTSSYGLGKPMGCTGTNALANGTAEGNVSAQANDWSCVYALEVPPGASNLRFVTSGGVGNGDLYVKRGLVPTDTSYDCKSAGDTTSETCAPTTAQTGTWYARVYGPAAFSGVSLTGSYSAVGPLPCSSVLPLSNNTVASSVSASASTWSCLYTLDVPAGATNLKFVTSGGSGDGDLYVKFGSAPTDASYDCKASTTSSAETCTINVAQPGTYHVRMLGYTSFSGVSLTGSYTSTVLPNGTAVTGLATTWAGSWSPLYTLEVPPGASNLQFVTSGGSGDANLYVKFGSAPTDTSYDCKSTGTSTSETCTLPVARAGTWYARVYGPTPYTGVSLKGSYTAGSPPTCTGVLPLSSGTAAGPLGASTAGWSCTYALEVPEGAGNLRFFTSGGSGNGDLYVRRGSAPDSTTYDCKSSGTTTSETCSIPAAQGGTWYVRVYGTSAFSGVNLTGAYTAMDCNVALPNGSPVSQLFAGADSWSCTYALDVPAGASNLKFTTTGGVGNASMYVRYGSAPDGNAFDCKSSGATTSEACTVPVARAGTWYVRLYGASAFSGVSLTGSYSSSNCTQELSNNVPVRGLSGSADTWSCLYTLEVPADATSLTFSTSGVSGSSSLYVRHGSAPDGTTYDCKSTSYCTPPAQAGIWYVRLQTTTGFSGVSLTGTYIPSIPLSNGIPMTHINGLGDSVAYTLQVPAGATNLRFVTSAETGSTGNSDLYVRFGSTSSATVCESKGSTHSETCNIALPEAGTYFVQLDGTGSYSGVTLTGSYNTTSPVPPANDTCATAQTLVFDSAGVAHTWGDTTLGGNSNAAGDASPTCSPSAKASGNDVVYHLTLTEPRSLEVFVTPTDARLAPVVYLRKAGDCASPVAATELACNTTDADGSGPVSLFVPNLPAGEYSLWVDGGVYKNWSGPTSFGRFLLEVQQNPPVLPPVNESCQTAQPLVFSYGVARAVGDTRTALNDNPRGCGDSTPLGAGDVAYAYTIEEEQDVLIELTPSEPAPLWKPVFSLRERDCSAYEVEDRCTLATYAGGKILRRFTRQEPGTYVIWVDGLTAKDAGPYELKVTLSKPSRNTSCNRAEPLTFNAAGDVFLRGDNSYAGDSTSSVGRPTCGNYVDYGGDIVYSFTVPSGPPQQVSFVVEPTVDSDMLPVVSLRRACALNTRADELVCVQLAPNEARHNVGIAAARLDPGTYYLWVDSNDRDGAFNLYGHMGAPNDTCATARPLTLASEAMPAVATSNVGMTNDYGPGSANPYGGTCGSSSESTVDSVYSFTAPASGKYYTDSNAMRFLGESCDPVACSASPVFDAVEGHTYYFVLDHDYGYSGTRELRLRPYPW